MDLSFLDFERPIAELEAKIEELRHVGSDTDVNINEEIARLKTKSRALTRQIFSNLTAWQIAQLARHPQRPYTLDYIERIFTDCHHPAVTDGDRRRLQVVAAHPEHGPAGEQKVGVRAHMSPSHGA